MLLVICDLAHIVLESEWIEITEKTKKAVTRRLGRRKQDRIRRGKCTGEVVQSQKTLSVTQTVIEAEFIDHMRCNRSIRANSHCLRPSFGVVEIAISCLEPAAATMNRARWGIAVPAKQGQSPR